MNNKVALRGSQRQLRTTTDYTLLFLRTIAATIFHRRRKQQGYIPRYS